MWSRYVALGDSVSAGIGDPVHGLPLRPWTAHLADQLRLRNPELEFRNLARRGLTAEEVQEQQLAEALAFQPDIVTLVAGGNDALKGQWDSQRTFNALDTMFGAVAETGATLLTMTVPDFPVLWQLPEPAQRSMRRQLLELNRIIAEIARRYGALCLETWHHPLTRDRLTWSTDGIHPNALGYVRLGEAATQLLLRPALTID